jgi:hypothetical protein
MATSYYRTSTGEADTEWKGSGPTPGIDNNKDFCANKENGIYTICGEQGDPCRWDFHPHTYCYDAVNVIESNTPLPR